MSNFIIVAPIPILWGTTLLQDFYIFNSHTEFSLPLFDEWEYRNFEAKCCKLLIVITQW